MHPRPLLLLTLAAACGGPARPAAPSPAEGSAASATALATAVARPWVRLTPQGTSMCLRLPDGSFHVVVYGVGGATGGFALRPSVAVPVTRDLVCAGHGVLALGAKGVLSQFDERGLRPQGAYPDARSLHVSPGRFCFVSAAGVVSCAEGRQPPFDVNAVGPVAELVGDDCARYHDGTLACRAGGGATPYQVVWPDVRQASIAGGVLCAVLASGQVSCRGDNRFAQRGFVGEVAHGEATLVPGLDRVDEVHTSGTHACARRGGEVWCWGQADEGQAGEAARRASRAWPRCEVDEAATERQRQEVAKAQAICSGPRPPGDDPFCRGAHGAYASTVFRGNPGHDCDPSGATRFALPTRVAEVTDAIALGARGSMTCALRASRALVCWGNGATRAQEVAIPIVDVPVERDVAPQVRTAWVKVNEWGVLVRGEAGGLTFHPWLDGPLGAGKPIRGAIDATLAPGVCTLAADGTTACEAAFDQPARAGQAPAGFDRFAGRERDCFASPEGALHCGRDGFGWGGKLTAAGDVVDAQGACAHYTDGAVRCFARRGGVLTADLVDVVPDAISLSEALWPLAMCVVRRGGGVWCIGGSFDLTQNPPPEPLAIAGAPPATAVSAAYQHACVLATDGTVWCWGRTVEGQVGPAAPRGLDVTPTPVAVPGVTDAIAIGVGTGRSCALTRARTLRCWGNGAPRLQSRPTDAP